jgi:DNA-binding SARP family transcriptional activator
LKDSPPWLRFVISSRRRPSLELARLSGMGEVELVATDDLRFTVEETRDLFSDGYGIALDSDVLDTVGEKTRGWAASLQLFQGSVHGRPASAVRALAMSLSGADSPMYDFLAQEVLKNIDLDVEEFLIRCSLLDRVTASSAVALFPDRHGLAPDLRTTASWIADCDHRGLLTRVSATSDARQLHPLLRDFLVRALSVRVSTEVVQQIHSSVAASLESIDPLAASLHYIEADLQAKAMTCLEHSTILAMGTGRWTDASRLADRLEGVPTGPAVAAMKARRLIDEGEFDGAAKALAAVDIGASAPEVRAAFRNAQLSLGWRTSDRELVYEALRSLQADPETPALMQDIAAVFVDASPLVSRRATMPALAQRLTAMSATNSEAGLQFFAAVSLHNATMAFLAGGDLRATIRTGEAALAAFEELSFSAAERFSTHSVLVAAFLELGNRPLADDHALRATESGEEFADVSAELAFNYLVSGDRKKGMAALARTETLVRQGRTDGSASLIASSAAAFASLPMNPDEAIGRLEPDVTFPVDFGEILGRRTVLALAYLLAGRVDECIEVASEAIEESRMRLARLFEARLRVIIALAHDDPVEASAAVSDAAAVGELALLQVADGIADHLDLFSPVPDELEASIARWPARWLPALRRQMEKGDVASARIAARFLDRYGELQDVGRLRAFALAYRKRGRVLPFGVELAQRVSPHLVVHDLGRVSISIGSRSVDVAGIRRKPASLLMYLVTRPSFTAHRDQVFDELWPDTDPGSASNSLNQSLYFLRREFDPWYEDDLSVEYVGVQGELVWLDPRLVSAESADFLVAAQAAVRGRVETESLAGLVMSYRGTFAPDFEYEEWAISWRTRIHTAFLELTTRALDRSVAEGDLATGRDIAVHALDVDPENPEVEGKLVWLYWHTGARAASTAQYEHLAARDRADGLEPVGLDAIVSAPKPI